jgi:DNA repair photolyase
MTPQISRIRIHSLLAKSIIPNTEYVINPYRGCAHGCIYCSAEYAHLASNGVVKDWSQNITIKSNAAGSLDQETLAKLHQKKILIGSFTDPYQPLESTYRLTRQILEKLVGMDPSITILTKSDLILRDIDVLKKFTNLKVGVSLSNLDEKIRIALEPRAASPQKRMSVLRTLHTEGVATFLFISPYMPGFTDFPALIELNKDTIDFVMFEYLSIRKNNWAKIQKFLQRHGPSLLPLYETIKHDDTYWNTIESDIQRYCQDKQVPYRIFPNNLGYVNRNKV